jgi:curli biogenesis system outer membrane secretion channel CsgG
MSSLRTKSSFPYLLSIGVFWIFTSACHGQEKIKPRIAVFPFDDRTTANKDMSIGTKVADLLIAKLATNGAVTVYDRQYVDRLLAEKNLKYDPNYDSAGAAKAGLMGTVDMVISGQIDAFNANANEFTKHQVVRSIHEIDGEVTLKVTARVISVEKGSILTAPSASDEQHGVLAVDNTYMKNPLNPKNGLGFDNTTATKNQDQALRKLVDQAAEEVAKQLSAQVDPIAKTIEPVMAAVSASKPEVRVETKPKTPAIVGMIDGLAYLDAGSASGVKKGEKFTVRRSSDTELKDGMGHPIQRHRSVCTLVITTVEEASAGGKCTPEPSAKGPDGIPRAGDEVIASTK